MLNGPPPQVPRNLGHPPRSCRARLAAHHATTRPDVVGFLYLDGHVRVYTGTRKLPKTHIARMRIAGPATEETWVGDADGDPVMVLTAAPSKSLAAELAQLLPDYERSSARTGGAPWSSTAAATPHLPVRLPEDKSTTVVAEPLVPSSTEGARGSADLRV